MIELKFQLSVEDGWPPVGIECLPFEQRDSGYQLTTAPLFVKDLSVGDIISPAIGDDGSVVSWVHIAKSDRTTIWMLRLGATVSIEPALKRLRELGCNTVCLEELGSFAIDVPGELPMESVDEVLASLNADEIACVFPSFRH